MNNNNDQSLFTIGHLGDKDKGEDEWQGVDAPKLVTISSVREQAKLFEPLLLCNICSPFW